MKRLIRSSRILLLSLPVILLFALSTNHNHRYNLSHALDPLEAGWVDSVFNTLSLDERIGQLFMIRAHSTLGPEFEQKVADEIRQYHVGGLCFFQGTPEHQAELTNRYQALSDKLPLFVAIDAEWGLGMRLKETAISYPKQIMLGAIQDNLLIYEMGRDLARQCRRLGVHINFAPVADINNNPLNPVINDRSFGESRSNVTAKAFQYLMGLQDGGVLACAKHFPGHGDTDVDSHVDLPIIPFGYGRLDSLELAPFRALSVSGVGGMMGSGGGPGDCGSSCTCDNGDTCEFTCSSSPCDANCVGASNCTAECANATCNCQGGSICSFFCTTPNCRVSCTQGSQCLLDCNTFAPQSVACDFQNCQSGTIACPDGKTLACNATCP